MSSLGLSSRERLWESTSVRPLHTPRTPHRYLCPVPCVLCMLWPHFHMLFCALLHSSTTNAGPTTPRSSSSSTTTPASATSPSSVSRTLKMLSSPHSTSTGTSTSTSGSGSGSDGLSMALITPRSAADSVLHSATSTSTSSGGGLTPRTTTSSLFGPSSTPSTPSTAASASASGFGSGLGLGGATGRFRIATGTQTEGGESLTDVRELALQVLVLKKDLENTRGQLHSLDSKLRRAAHESEAALTAQLTAAAAKERAELQAAHNRALHSAVQSAHKTHQTEVQALRDKWEVTLRSIASIDLCIDQMLCI
jgi:hypothetical protein